MAAIKQRPVAASEGAMRNATLNDEPAVETPTLPAPPIGRRAARPYGWWAAAAGLVILLVALGVAEADWLHHLPQDRASRITLIAAPAGSATGGTGNGAAPGPDWTARLLAEATDPGLMAEVVERLDLRDGAAGRPLPAATLAETLRLGSECIELRDDGGPPRRGLMLNAVVRSGGAIDTEAVAQAWAERFIERSRAELPGLTIQPAATMGVPYELCR
jgi:hypothetical protein